MKRTAIIAAMLLLGASRAGAQVSWQTNDSCLCLYQNFYPGLWYNPDSVMVDTCSLQTWDYPWYAKRWYGIRLDSDFFHFPIAPIDSIIETTWRKLDTSYVKTRASFDSLERKYGIFILRKFYVDEATGPLSGAYHIGFDSLVQEDDVLTTLEGLIDGAADFYSIPVPIFNAVNPSLKVDLNVASAFPNPTTRETWITGCNRSVSDAVITDVLGRQVRTIAISPPSTEFNIDLGGLGAGIYTISADGTPVTRLILQP